MARYSNKDFIEERNEAIYRRFHDLIRSGKNSSQAYDKMVYEFWETRTTLIGVMCIMRKKQQLTLF